MQQGKQQVPTESSLYSVRKESTNRRQEPLPTIWSAVVSFQTLRNGQRSIGKLR